MPNAIDLLYANRFPTGWSPNGPGIGGPVNSPLAQALIRPQATEVGTGGPTGGNYIGDTQMVSRQPNVYSSSALNQEQGDTGVMTDTRFYVVDKATGKVNTGLNNGSDPRQFNSVEEMRQWMRSNGESADMEFDSPQEAIQAVRTYTGNPSYNGYYEGYQPPAPSAGSPAARGVPFAEWNSTQNQGAGVNNKGTPEGGWPPPPAPPGGTAGSPPPGAPPAHGSFGPNYTDRGYYGDQSATVPGLPKDLQDALRQLMDEARNQVAQGKEALTGITSDYKDQLAFQRAGATQTYDRQNYLTNLLLGLGANGQIGENGQYTPGSLGAGISSAIGTMNDATGLSPEAMAALRMQAIEGPEAAYQGQVGQLKSQLASRGAYGGGETPGDLGAIVGGYAPLMQNRDSTRSNLLSQAILANEQRKFDTLGLNRQTAANAMGTAAGLTTGLGNVFNPSSWLNTSQQSLAGLGGLAGGLSDIGFKGIDTAGGLAGTLNDAQGTSFSSLLKNALLGAGINAASNLDWGKIAAAVGGIFTGGGGNTQTTNTNPSGNAFTGADFYKNLFNQ